MRLNFSQNVRSALRALLANKLRSALTMLGIVIGVGAVVALLSIGTGAQASITNRIEGIGANLITVFAGTRNQNTPSGAGAGATAPLTYEEAQQLKGLTGVAAVSPEVTSRSPLKVGTDYFGKQRNTGTIPAIGWPKRRRWTAGSSRRSGEPFRRLADRTSSSGRNGSRNGRPGSRPAGRWTRFGSPCGARNRPWQPCA